MKKLFISVFCLALFLRIGFIFLVPHQVMHNDSEQYHKIAVNLSSGHGYSIEPDVPTARRAPLYPLTLASMYILFGVNAVPVEILQAILGSFMCLVVFKIGKEIFTESIARTAMVITAIYPYSYPIAEH